LYPGNCGIATPVCKALCIILLFLTKYTAYPFGDPNKVLMPFLARLGSWVLMAVWTTSAFFALDNDAYSSAIQQMLVAIVALIVRLNIDLQPWVINEVPSQCDSKWNFSASLVFWPVPLPFIASMDNSDGEVGVEVTRFSPARDLGLLGMYKERKPVSGARAKMVEGNILTPSSYKVKMKSVWDGEKL
ncbi:hypothetical protein ACFL96_15145, partial [Thermoproteota archaeon]